MNVVVVVFPGKEQSVNWKIIKHVELPASLLIPAFSGSVLGWLTKEFLNLYFMNVVSINRS